MSSLLHELKEFRHLKWIGVILGAEHLINLIYWLTERPVLQILSSSTPAICWPFFSHCEDLKPGSAGLIAILSIYAALIILTIGLWAGERFRLAIANSWGILLLRFFLLSLDYRLGGDGYLAFILMLAFLLLPHRNHTMWATFVVYFITLAFSALMAQTAQSWPSFIIYFLVSVVLVSAYRRPYFNLVLGILVVFQLYSWNEQGFFNVATFLCLLGILIVCYEEVGAKPPPRASPGTKIALGLFIFLQSLQYLLPGEIGLTGEGRTYALSQKSQLLVECQPHLVLWKSNRSKDEIPLQVPWLKPHMTCDPIIYWRTAQAVCRWVKSDPTVIQVDLGIPIRKRQSAEWRPLANALDVCNTDFDYSSFIPNPWISKTTGTIE